MADPVAESLKSSSAVGHIAYDDDAREMTVTFVTGRVYLYSDVDPDTFEDFIAAESKGRYFNARIRGKFDYKERLPATGEGR